MAVKGVFSSDMNIAGTEKQDLASALLQTEPTGSAPLFALSSGMESADAMSIVVTWFEENHLTGRANVTNNAASGVTLVVDDASFYTAGVILFVETTGEYIYIEAVSGSTLTVSRGLGGTTITAINGTSTPVAVQRISTAYEEGSPKPMSVANIGFPRFNYMQIFRNPWDVTGTARAVEYHTGDLVAKNKRDAALFHAEDIERAVIFGVRTIGIQNSKPFRTMDGIVNQLSSNVTAQSTNTTWDDIDDWLKDIFQTNIKGKPNERIAFSGNTVVQVLNKIARLEGSIDLMVGQTDFGLEVTKWRTPYGTISLLTHPLFNENPTWTKNLLVLHPGAIRMRWLRRTSEDSNERDGTRAGADADFGVITSELSVEYKAEATGGYYTGIDTAAAT